MSSGHGSSSCGALHFLALPKSSPLFVCRKGIVVLDASRQGFSRRQKKVAVSLANEGLLASFFTSCTPGNFRDTKRFGANHTITKDRAVLVV